MSERQDPRQQYSFDLTHSTSEAREFMDLASEQAETVGIAGRLLAIRDQGGLIFANLHDQDGNIQIVADQETTPDFEGFRTNNVGDWVGITGRVGATKRGEPSVFVEEWAKLAQTEIPFPSKRDGVTDPEIIYRQRYIDLAVNPESRQKLIERSRIVSLVRRGLEDQGFMEVETPILQTLHGGAAARPFTTHHNALDMELYLRIAPELFLKRLVVGGLTKVFEIGKDFRNEGVSTRHNPEFTMMEAYAAYWDHEGQMKLTEDLVSNIAQEVRGSKLVEYQGREIDLTPPWPRIPMDELVSKQLGEEVSVDTDMTRLLELCDQHGVVVESSYGPGKLLQELYEKTVESSLWGPIFVTDYPQEVSPLARSHRSRPGYTERFEGIVGGMELCNGFSELNDPREQHARFKDQERASEHDDETMPMDHDYIRSLMYGLPPTAGLGIGMDRLAMLLTNSSSIRDIVLFPTLKPDGYKSPY